MDQNNAQVPPVRNEGAQQQAQGSTQSAQADLQAVAARAKAASQGFQLNKLFEGRIDNKNFFYYVIASIVLGWILRMIPIIGWLISIALLVLSVGVTIRRFHDIGTTGWATLVMIIPLINLLVLIYLCWKQGDAGANAYGPVPDPKREFFKAVLNT